MGVRYVRLNGENMTLCSRCRGEAETEEVGPGVSGRSARREVVESALLLMPAVGYHVDMATFRGVIVVYAAVVAVVVHHAWRDTQEGDL